MKKVLTVLTVMLAGALLPSCQATTEKPAPSQTASAGASGNDATRRETPVITEVPVFTNDRSTFLARIEDSEGIKVAMAEWQPALEKATNLTITRQDLFLFLPKVNPLWDQNNKFQREVSSRYVNRLATVPFQSIKEWADATGDDLPAAALRVVGQDAVFDNERFQEESFKKLLNNRAKGQL